MNFFTYSFLFRSRVTVDCAEFSRVKSEDMIYYKLQRWRLPRLAAVDVHVDKAGIFFHSLFFLLLVRKAINHINHIYTILTFNASVERGEKLNCVRRFLFVHEGARNWFNDNKNNFVSTFYFRLPFVQQLKNPTRILIEFEKRLSALQQWFRRNSTKTPEVRLLRVFIWIYFEQSQTERRSSAHSLVVLRLTTDTDVECVNENFFWMGANVFWLVRALKSKWTDNARDHKNLFGF